MHFLKTKKAPHTSKRGFTLVETLVSILIFSLITGAIASAVVTSTRTLAIINEKLVATYLTQDAMEYIKNIRDTQTRIINPDPDDPWYGEVLEDCVTDDVVCSVDTVKNFSSAINDCPSGSCSPLWYNTDTKQYIQIRGPGSNYERSQFTREVTLSHPDLLHTGEDEVLVKVVVRWNSYGRDREVTLYHSIFNWQR